MFVVYMMGVMMWYVYDMCCVLYCVVVCVSWEVCVMCLCSVLEQVHVGCAV